jgi:lipoprotein-anchoring transpeptidase ErfK/SrfK
MPPQTAATADAPSPSPFSNPPADATAPPVAAVPNGAVPNSAVPNGAAQGAPADPYAEPYQHNAADRYQTPQDQASPYGTPAEQAPPATAPPVDPAAAGTNPAAAPPAGATGEFTTAMASARRELEGGQLASALKQLSSWYQNPKLSPQESQELNQLLDQVAGSVVYSTQHLLEPPYEVQQGERLEDIGAKYNVPWELLAKINGIDDPSTLRPGERLKVVRGPFQAVVSLEHRELTLLTGDGSYAGRFKIGIGNEHPPQEGTFVVAEKVANPVYYGRERAISAEDPQNPLGERWIGLGNHVGIHGTNNPESIGRGDLPGSISLNERDVADVYDILSVGSRVTIRR